MARRVRSHVSRDAVTALPATTIELRHVSKRYGDVAGEVAALSDIDLSVRPGEFVAVMGPSGSGKSTLLHVIGSIDQPTEGEVVVDGVVLSSLSGREAADYRNRKVGFTFQMFNLLPALTVEENLWLPAAIAGLSRRWVADRVGELLAEVGIEDKRRRYPHELSGGEQQRVALARAVLLRPAVLLADEPTGSLDASSTGQVADLLQRLHRQGQVILLATHNPRVAALADRVVYLRDGSIEQEFSLTGEEDLPDDLDGIVTARRQKPLSLPVPGAE